MYTPSDEGAEAMNISPIKTKRDHERALLRIEHLMDAKLGHQSRR